MINFIFLAIKIVDNISDEFIVVNTRHIYSNVQFFGRLRTKTLKNQKIHASESKRSSSFKIDKNFTNLYTPSNALSLNFFHHFRSLVFIKSKFLIFGFQFISITPIAPTTTRINKNLYSGYVYEGSLYVVSFLSTILQVLVSRHHIRKSGLLCLTLAGAVIDTSIHPEFHLTFFFDKFSFVIN